MKIELRLLLVDNQLSGLDLGDFSLYHEEMTITSAGKTPSQSMMIFIFLSDFLELLDKLAAKKPKTPQKIIAADSSFALTLTLTGQHLVVQDSKVTIVSPFREFLDVLYTDITQWLDPLKFRIPPNDPALGDLISALARLKARPE